MSDHCCSPPPDSRNPAFRRALWIALWLNAAMFIVEVVAGVQAGSMALLADAIDFAGDAANYGISLVVLAMAPIWRSRAALLKGLSMLGFALFVATKTILGLLNGAPPEALTMGIVASIALCVNVGVAVMLYAFRTGDANMRSVWLCSRNDAISNVAVMLAALGVFGTGAAWPDLVVAAIMASLALQSGLAVVRHSLAEMRQPA